MHELAYLHPLSGVPPPASLCASCENQGGLRECLQVPRGLSPTWPKKGGVSIGAVVVWCPRYSRDTER